MGCAQSKEDTEGPVGRCRERKHLLRAAVAARHALSVAHYGHTAALKNVGAAVSDYASGEAHDGLLRSASAAAAAMSGSTTTATIPPTMDAVFPPPPPLPQDIVPAPAPAPLVRSISAPDLPIPTIKKKLSGEASSVIIEEDDAEGGDGEADVDSAVSTGRHEEENPPPPPVQPAAATAAPTQPPPLPPQETEHKGVEATSWEYFFGSQDAVPPPTLELDTAEPSWAAETRELEVNRASPPLPQQSVVEAAVEKKVEEPPPPPPPVVVQKAARKAESKKGRAVVVVPQPPSVSVVKILHKLDDHFLKASESTHDVSKMLEAARMHYHSNFTETRGYVDHSARVMQVITWNRSFRGIPQPENVKNELDDDEWETHATILDKMLAWEKKLYHEVKAAEVIKMEYQQKLAVLNKKKQRGVNSASLEKTKSVVSHLHTRYVVDMQTMDSTIAEINRLRDDQLYPKLLELVRGMGKMWEAIHKHHSAQLKIITELKSFDISVATRETSEQHHDRTEQLWNVVRDWHLQFDKLMTHKKEYIENLYYWLKLNVIPIETNLKEKDNPSPPQQPVPPIKRLLHAWHDFLGKLPDEATKKAIYAFSEVIRTIMVHQDDELKMRINCEEMRKDLERKKRQFEDWARKYMERRAGILPEDNNPDGANHDPLAERKTAVERLEVVLKEEEDQYRRQCRTVREKSLGSLRTHLPELFRAVSDFSLHSAAMYKSLWSIAHSNDQQLED